MEKGTEIMLRAMDSAVAGLRSHQNKMDVVGHNIANVNTFGFKAQTYTFKEAMYQTSTASTAGGKTGGVNAAQYGYGTLMGSIGMDMTASTPSYVGGFNASIDGEGFYITRSTKLAENEEQTSTSFKKGDFDYTRVGQFQLDSNGYVTDANGNFLYGFRVTGIDQQTGSFTYDDKLQPLRVPYINGPGNATDLEYEFKDSENPEDAAVAVTIEINNAGVISASVKYGDAGKEATRVVTLGKVAIATFQNPNGVTKGGGNYYKATDNDNTGRGLAAAPGEAGTSTLMGGFIESSNVDLAKEFADMITTHRGFQANSKMITVSDEMLQDLVSMKR